MWLQTKIIKFKKWNQKLFTIILTAPILPFKAGQFTKLSFITEENKRIQNAYSFVNAPKNKNLEFYILLVPNGVFTNFLYNMKLKKIFITKKSSGYFTLDEIPICENLWMFATGTAIGPFLSILQENSLKLKKFKKIIVIYAVKFENDLNYLFLLKKLQILYQNRLFFQIILSQEKNKKFLFGRIPNLIKNFVLENSVGIQLNAKNSHVMLCGNPGMIQETQHILKKYRNMNKNLRSKPGHVTIEKYW
ncbi:ferredoxin--NADP(+) reductase [Buchnera aphidicola]|uniref:Flavodoxin/ferredoxin--NADP reductase n=1 Tax=Buchnera aphidicola subsp. Tuberolachnus salignus TaxID=98804 RepID=A0A160SYK7_BUCTT|nr:ferredoxin--NADP(+) reductase [Buchnera aphidicola]CUR53354.1 Ferredoxin--NADP reductase [Buchnera aphidicola (Tuberolachnus salignus)]